MCQDLRVLNAVRDYQIGIPLTFTQYLPSVHGRWARAAVGGYWSCRGGHLAGGVRQGGAGHSEAKP